MDRDRWLALGLSTGGVIGGHALAYTLAHPLVAAREAYLSQTGHAGFELLSAVGFAAAGLALALAFVRGARREGRAPGVLTLLWIQVALFLALELSERGFDVAAAATDPAVLLGVPVQLALAVALALVARGVVEVSYRVGVGKSPGARRPVRVPAPVRVADPEAPDLAALGLRRAPPMLSVA